MTITDREEPISRFWSKIGLIAEIAKMLREMPASRQVLVEVLEKISSVIGFDSATLYLLNGKTDTLEEVASIGQKVNLLDFLRLGKGYGLAGWVADQARPVLIPGRTPEVDGVRQHHDSMYILPLLVGGTVLGVLCLSHHSCDAFDESRQKVLEIVADQVAISIERIMKQRELESKNSSLREAQEKLKQAQEQLLTQEKMRAVAELAASVNHEVNNPLSIIIGNAQMIELDADRVPPEVAARIKSIVDGARRISLITHKLLKIDRLVSDNYLNDAHDTMLDLNRSCGDQL